MTYINPLYLAHERQRFTRPDAHRFVRPDWRRFVSAGSELEALYEDFERKYSPDQPRVSAGSREGGRWASGGGSGGAQVAQLMIGTLAAEIPVAGGRRCVYNFGLFSVVVPGPANFRCMRTMPLAGTTHGQLLNDN